MHSGPLEVRHHSHLLRHIVNAHGWQHGAELGLMRGRTFETLLRDCPELKWLVGVDAFEYMPDAPGSEPYKDIDHESNHKRCMDIQDQYKGRASLLRMTTTLAAAYVDDESLDFVFIDADHSYEGVKQDIEDWLPKVKRTGWILGHDYAPYWKGVMQAVDERFGKPCVMDIRDRIPEGGTALLPGKVWAIAKADT